MTNSPNPHYISQNANGSSMTQPVDTVDFPHSGLIKSLNQMAAGNVVVKTGTDFDINQTGGNLVVAAGKILRNGEYQEVATKTFADSSLTTTYAKGYHLLVVADGREGGETVNVLYMRPPTANERVPEFKLGDTIVAMIEYSSATSAGSRLIQYFTTNKESNSLSIAYANSNVYTPTASIVGAAAGTTVTNTVGDFIIDNTDTNDQIVMRLGTDDANTGFEIRNNSDAVKFAVNGAGTMTLPALSTATVAADDKVIIRDTNDSDAIKTVTAQSIADLGGGGSLTFATFREDNSSPNSRNMSSGTDHIVEGSETWQTRAGATALHDILEDTAGNAQDGCWTFTSGTAGTYQINIQVQFEDVSLGESSGVNYKMQLLPMYLASGDSFPSDGKLIGYTRQINTHFWSGNSLQTTLTKTFNNGDKFWVEVKIAASSGSGDFRLKGASNTGFSNLWCEMIKIA